MFRPATGYVSQTAVSSGPAAIAFYSTGFPSTENPLSDGGRWVQGLDVGVAWGNVQSTPGLCFATRNLGGFNDDIAHLTGSWPANQFAQGTVFLQTGYTASHEIELFVMFQITANNARGYEWFTNTTSGGSGIVRWNGAFSDFTSLSPTGAGPGQVATGDVLRLEATVSGSTVNLVAKKNGTTVYTVSDTVWLSGAPGLGFDVSSAGTQSSFGWSAYSAGGL